MRLAFVRRLVPALLLFSLLTFTAPFVPAQSSIRLSRRVTDPASGYTLPLDEWRSLRFHGKVDNVFDRSYFESGFRRPGAVFIGGATLRF